MDGNGVIHGGERAVTTLMACGNVWWPMLDCGVVVWWWRWWKMVVVVMDLMACVPEEVTVVCGSVWCTTLAGWTAMVAEFQRYHKTRRRHILFLGLWMMMKVWKWLCVLASLPLYIFLSVLISFLSQKKALQSIFVFLPLFFSSGLLLCVDFLLYLKLPSTLSKAYFHPPHFWVCSVCVFIGREQLALYWGRWYPWKPK